jgi:hypothetical protein
MARSCLSHRRPPPLLRSHYDRCARLYRSLRSDDIRSSRDLAALEGCERLFNRARGAADIPFGYGLQRADPPRHRRAAGRNPQPSRHLAQRPRRKGPRFDPARIPTAALERLIQRHPDLDTLDRLIQRHPDLDTLDRLRAERRRRQPEAMPPVATA